PDENPIYIGSADLMPRNLYNRVELVTPVQDPSNKDQLTDALDRAFADSTSSWELGADGVWSRLTVNGDPPRNMQTELIERHTRHADEAAAVRARPAAAGPDRPAGPLVAWPRWPSAA